MGLQNIKESLRQHAKSVGIATVGIISAAAIPVWQIYFVETPDIHIEISEIRRINSSTYRVPLGTEELRHLIPYIDENLFYETTPKGERGDRIQYPTFDVETLLSAYESAKLDLKNIAETKQQLEKYIATIDAYLDPSNHAYLLTEFRVGEMKSWGLSHYIDDDEAHYYEQEVLEITRNYSDMKFNAKKTPVFNIPALKFLLSDLKEDLQDVISTNDHRLEKLKDNLRGLDAQLNTIKKEQRDMYSYYEVDAIATNSGRASDSFRSIGMLRVNISANNYVDVHLDMMNFQQNSELEPASTKMLRYRSDELYQLPVEDRTLVNTFWGSTGQVRLLNLDTRHHVYVSNPITFANNGNHKSLFDHLKKVAASL